MGHFLAHRHFHIDDVCYPSVTTIINIKPKPWLDKWREKHGDAFCDAVVKEANTVGTEFHSIAEHLVNRVNVAPSTPQLAGMAASLKVWLSQHQIIPEVQEHAVYSVVHQYQGTLDFIGTLNGILVVIDWKSSNTIYEDMGLQLVAYARAFEERTGLKIKTGWIVQVSKKPPYKLATREFKLGKRLFKEFLALREEYGTKECDGLEVVNLFTEGGKGGSI